MVILNMFGLAWHGKVRDRNTAAVVSVANWAFRPVFADLSISLRQVVLFSAIGFILCVLLYGVISGTPLMQNVS